MSAVRLGPFELQAPLGQGGMGEVWRGRHVGQDLPVAVKVITAVQAREPGFQAAFRNEVQAVAGLDHPGIVMVFDYGEVPQPAAEASGGRLRAGSPYLVMELLTGGRLDKQPPATSWTELRSLLLNLLGALAHAHARGVVHRDLKLSNVLLAGPSDLRPGYRIIDFGLATTGTPETGAPHEISAGTPAFEAPEQILGRWRDQGPWTDLYAFGCMAYALTTGGPPFDGQNLEQVHRCHLMVPMPPLDNWVSVPTGYEGWLKRLLAKHPRDRFQCAAEAAYGLRTLPDSLTESAPIRPPREPELTTRAEVRDRLTEEITRPVITPQTHLAMPSPGSLVTSSGVTEEAMPRRVPALPASWQDETPHAVKSTRFIDAGLGLYGLRAVPLVDREAERDWLWQKLGALARDGQPRLALLKGQLGCGKSRLVEWLARRAHEASGITTLRAVHSRIEGPADGLARMVAQHLGCVGLGRPETLARTERILREQGVADAYEWNALTELIIPATKADLAAGARPVNFRHPTARYALIRRVLERIAQQNPVIVWLDDVQWGFDALVFAKYILRAQRRAPVPVLLALTAQNESLAETAQAKRVVSELVNMEHAESLEVPPLAPRARLELVHALIGLEGDLAEQVAARTGGNPLYAVQLLDDWVDRSLLQVSEAGFALREGQPIHLPDNLHELWKGRVDRIVADHADSARDTLEQAAALGRDIDDRELRRALAEASLKPDEAVVTALTMGGLVRPTAGGWSFVHAMLRESIEREAREAGRWQALNARCAAMLDALYEPTAPGIADRLGRHRLEAGQAELAVEPLLVGAREHHDRSEYLTALSLLSERERALTSMFVPESSEARLEGWILRARVHLLQGQLERALSFAGRAETIALGQGWPVVRAQALRALAYGRQQQGDLNEAEELYSEARALFADNDEVNGLAACLHGLGEVARLRADNGPASDYNEQALRLFEETNDRIGVSNCLRSLGVVTQHQGDLEGAVQLYERALEGYHAEGNPYGVAVTVNDLAEVARWRGQLEEAEAGYRRALGVYDAIGSHDRVITQLNLALVLLARERFEEAREQLLAGAEVCEQLGRLGFLGGVHAALLPSTAKAGDWPAFDAHLKQAQELLGATAVVDLDIAWTAQMAGDLAAERRQWERARGAYLIALGQYQALGEDHAACETEDRLTALGAALLEN